MEIAELKAMVEERQKRKQMATALCIGVAIVGLFVIFTPKQAPAPESKAVTVASTTNPAAFANVPIQGKAAIVYDLTSNKTLYAKNADTQLPLASLTKLLTLYAASKVLSPNSVVTITPTALAQYGDYGLKQNEQFTFSSIARFALVVSSNDAAEAIAEAASEKLAQSNATMLANVASSLGLAQTYALNPTGLDESTTVSGGYGSAHDVAVLAGKLLAETPSLAAATIQPSVSVTSIGGTVHSLPNTNQDVVHLPRLLLSKTGYTDLAGGNLAIVYDAGINHPIAVVVLGSTEDSRFTDVDALVAATNNYFAGTTTQP